MLLFAFSSHAKKVSVSCSLGLKKHFLYNKGQLFNTENTYKFGTKLQPLLGITATYTLNKKVDLQFGATGFPLKYWCYYSYTTHDAYFKQQSGLGVSTLQIPIRAFFKLSKRVAIGGGFAFNYHSFDLKALKTSFGGSDSFDIAYYAYSSEFQNYFSISSQIIATYKLAKRWNSSIVFDIDYGAYPTIFFEHDVTNYRTNENISTNYEGAPKMFYLGLTLNYVVW